MKTGSWRAAAFAVAVALGLACGPAEARDLRIAAWNLEHLNDEHGEGCVERTEEDFAAIARQIEVLDADVVAFQEVENEAAARRVFDPARWHVVMSSRPDTGARPACWDRPEGRLQHQGTGIAVRRSVAFRRGADLSALAGGDPHLRWGTHIVVGRGARQLHVLSVHLKSGCWGKAQDEQGRDACTVLRAQVSALRAWIDEQQRGAERFVIAGDFNRRLTIPDDWAWSALSPNTRPLELATEGRGSGCDARFPNFIDHLVVWGPGGTMIRPGTFREGAREGRHPDHCPVSVALGDAPAGAVETRTALKAWIGAFGRVSTDQMVGGIERRLAWQGGAHATFGGVALADEDGPPDLPDLLSRASFRVSPGGATRGHRWTLWGAGAAGTMSSGEHDVRGRVRSAILGADMERGATTLGVALSHSRGTGSTTPTGRIEGEVSTVAPYLGLTPREGVRMWGVLGKGSGTLRYEPTPGHPIRTDLDTTLGAAGLRIAIGEAYQVRWSARANAALTAVRTGEIADLAPINARAGHLRAGVEGAQRFELAGGSTLTPNIEAGLRRDQGDGGQGTAVELGAGLHYLSPGGRLEVTGRARTYLAQEGDNGWELGGALALHPDARQRGLSLTLAPKWGGGAPDRATDPHSSWYLASEGMDSAELAAEIGYGVAFAGGRGAVRPFAAVDWGSHDERTMQVGARWQWGEAWSLALEAERETTNDFNDTYTVLARTQLRW